MINATRLQLYRSPCRSHLLQLGNTVSVVHWFALHDSQRMRPLRLRTFKYENRKKSISNDLTITAYVQCIFDVGSRKTPSFTCLCHVLWSSCFTYWPPCPPWLHMVSLCFICTYALKNGHDQLKWAQSRVRGLHLYPYTYLTLSTNELSIRSPNWLNNTSLTVAEYLDHCSVASIFSLVLLSVKHFSTDLRYKSERSLQAASEETVSPAIRYLLNLIKPSGIQPYLIQRPGCTTQSTPFSDALVLYHWNQHYQIPNMLWKGGGGVLPFSRKTHTEASG